MSRSKGRESCCKIERSLYRACRRGNKHLALAIIDRIPEHNLPIVQRDESDINPLHEACRHGWLNIVQILIESLGYKLDVRHKLSGQSPLHISCGYGRVDIVIYLTKRGCIPMLTDIKDKSPLDYALDNDYIYIVCHICKHCISSAMMNMLAMYRKITVLNLIRKMLHNPQAQLDWKTADGDNIIELVFHSKLVSHMPSECIMNMVIVASTESHCDSLPYLLCRSQYNVSCVPSALMLDWLSNTRLDPMKLVVSHNWKTVDGDSLLALVCRSKYILRLTSTAMLNWLTDTTLDLVELIEPTIEITLKPVQRTADDYSCTILLQLVCQSQSCISRISSTVMLKWLTAKYDVMNYVVPNYATADGDTILQLVCQSEMLVSRTSSLTMESWLENTNVDLFICIVGLNWKTNDGIAMSKIIRQLESCPKLISGFVIITFHWPLDDHESIKVLSQSDFLLQSKRLLKWMNQTNLNLEKIVMPDWKTQDGYSVLELVCQSESCVSQLSSKVMLGWLTGTTLDLTKVVIPNYKTADGDTLLQLVCQSESIISRIFSATLVLWLKLTNIDLLIDQLDWTTVDGKTMTAILHHLLIEHSISVHSSCLSSKVIITPHWKTDDGSILRVLYLSEMSISQLSSTRMLKWLHVTTLDLEKIIVPHWKTADGDTLLQLIYQSELCVSRISSSVMLEWLINTSVDVSELIYPKWKTACGDSLLQIITNSESCLSCTSSEVLLKWLSDSTVDIGLCLNPSLKTSNGDSLLTVVCNSKSCVSSIPSTIMLQWLTDTTHDLMELIVPSDETADGDTLLQLVCQSQSCVARITSNVMETWLKGTTSDLVVSDLNWTTADGVTVIAIIKRIITKPLRNASFYYNTVVKAIITPHWETDAGIKTHQVLFLSKWCISCTSSTELLNWLHKTKIDLQKLIVPSWKTINGDTLIKLVFLSESCVSRISSAVMQKWLTETSFNGIMPNYKTADGDTLLQLICWSELCVSLVSSVQMDTWLRQSNVDLLISGLYWKTDDGVNMIKVLQLLQLRSFGQSIDPFSVDAIVTPHLDACSGSTTFYNSEICYSYMSSSELLNWLQKTTFDLEKLIVPNWNTADGDTLFQLVCESESCLSRISSAVMLKWLTDIRHNVIYIKAIVPNYKTADGDTLFQLVCQSQSYFRISFTVILKWLTDTPLDLTNLVLPNLETADGDTLLQLICSSESCVSRISSSVMLKWLFVATCDLNLVKLNYETADGDTLFQLVCHSEPLVSCISSTEIIKGLIDTTYDLTKLKVTTCKTADGDTLLQLICQTESCVSRISSPVMLNWLIGTTSDLSKHIVVPMYTTADGDTLLQLVCKSESCVSFVSSSVMLKWLTNTTNNITKLIVPNWITANGDTLLDLVFHSESLLSQITSEKLLSWLDSSNAQLTGCILCSWKTANEDTLFKLICTSQCSLTHMSSALMLDWLNNGSERKINILEMVCPNWTTSNGDAVWHLFCQSNVKEDEVIELLLSNKEVLNPNFRSSEGNTAIHLACKADKPAIVVFLMTELHCDINVTNNSELLPIEMTKNPEIILSICQYYDSVAIPTKAVIGWLNSTATIDNQSMMEIFKELNHKHKLKACDGSTLLHLCCGSIDNFFRDKLSLVHYLLNVLQCDPNNLDNNGQMPLQVTLDSRIMKKLVHHGAKITSDVVFKMISDKYMTLYTSEHKVIKILLLSTTKKTMLWRPNDLNNDGDTALHLACKVGRPAIVKYLLKNANCNPSAKNSRNELPIELTTNIEIISLLVEYGATMAPELFLKLAAIESIPNNQLAQVMWNPDITNNEGNTALHLACQSDLPDTVNLLLLQTHCDPNVKNNNEEVPLQMTTNSDIIKDLIRYGAKTSIMYKSHKSALGTNKPIKPPVKIFVVGNPSVGKSTLTAALKKKLNIVARWFTSGKVSGVEKKTVGIIPHEIESEVFGRVTVYDFAGHREFYSGHTALLKAAIQSTPPIFLLVVNLLDGESEIIQNVLYWVSFLENQCTFVSCKPHLIIIGSHADTLKSKGVSPQEKVDTLLGLFGRNYFINLEFIGFIPMDCQLHESTGMNDLRPLLVRSCSQLRIQEPITFNAHCFLVHLLETFKGKPAVTISTICKQIEKQLLSQREGVLDFLPKSTGTVYKICVELNERGHILFLKDKKNVENSYVVIEEKSLLSEVSGTVFASKHFKEYKQLATNSGVVSLSKIKECFPDKDLGILMGFLTHLEFCHEISDQALLLLISEKYATKLDSYYLFPELISLKAKESVWKANCDFKYDFGWILHCTEPEQFFSSRFIQVLLLRLAFSFALESSSGHPDKFSFHQKCSLWKNGIFWGKHFGMEMLVETIKSKSVVVMARFKTSHLVKCLEQRSQVLHTVLECIQEFCPRISTVESFIDTSSNSPLEYPFEVNFTERTLCTVKDLAEALAVNYDNPSVVLSESGNCLSAKSFFTFEPYAEIEASTLQELWDENNENIAVSVAFLSRLVKNVSTNLELLTNIFSKSDSAHFKPYNKENVIQKILNWMKSSKTELMTYSQLHKELDRHSVLPGDMYW